MFSALFDLLVLFLGVMNIAIYSSSHDPLNLAAGLFAIIVFVVTALRK